jgi:hypothetical protein
MDYESGRFLVFDEVGEQIGRVDGDEFIRNFHAQPIYRLDGEEVYDMKGNFLGVISNGILMSEGSVFLQLLPE